MAKFIGDPDGLPKLGDGGVPSGPITTDGIMIFEHEGVTIQVTAAMLMDLFGGSGGAGFAALLVVSTTTHDVDNTDGGKYMRFTHASAKSCTFRPNATHGLSTASEFNMRNAGAGDLTLIAGSGVTIHPPAGGTLVIEEGMSVTVKRVATDEFDVIGQTVPA